MRKRKKKALGRRSKDESDGSTRMMKMNKWGDSSTDATTNSAKCEVHDGERKQCDVTSNYGKETIPRVELRSSNSLG